MPTPAVPQPQNIPCKDGLPIPFRIEEGPSDDTCPRAAYAIGIPADAEMLRKGAEKVRAMAILADVEVPEDFDEQMAEVIEAASEGEALLDAHTFVLCWN